MRSARALLAPSLFDRGVWPYRASASSSVGRPMKPYRGKATHRVSCGECCGCPPICRPETREKGRKPSFRCRACGYSDGAIGRLVPALRDPILPGARDVGLRLVLQLAPKVPKTNFDQEVFPPVSRRPSAWCRSNRSRRWRCGRRRHVRNQLFDLRSYKQDAERLQVQLAVDPRLKVACFPILFERFMAVLVRNLRPEILVMQPAQNWDRQRATDSLDGTRDRRVLVQR